MAPAAAVAMDKLARLARYGHLLEQRRRQRPLNADQITDWTTLAS